MLHHVHVSNCKIIVKNSEYVEVIISQDTHFPTSIVLLARLFSTCVCIVTGAHIVYSRHGGSKEKVTMWAPVTTHR